MNTFEDITSIDNLSNILRTPKKKLTYILYIKKIQNSYTTFQISKKSGGQRIINAPSKDLKDIQRNIVNMLLNQQKKFYYENKIRLNIAHAFTKEKSIITNAKIHKNKRFVLNIDLENFFESFHFGRVQGYFEKNKNYLFPKNIATVLAQLTCYNGSLPQGAPSSPIITNLICNILDMKILKIAKKYKLDYTRYADDLTFSTNNKGFDEKSEEFISQLEMIIKQSGFKINRKKTRLQYKQSRQVVTGLVVNKKVNMPRNFYKNTRAMANSLYKNGSFTINGVEGSLKQLEGRFSFINHINKENNKEKKKIDKNSKLGFRNLNGQEKEYQKFLFYKYFFNNEKPCILTEGPTDIIYLKSALKNLYTDYPKLIKKVNDDFIFKISFLKRGEDPKASKAHKKIKGQKTSKLQYFFGLEKDGADTMKQIYNFYVSDKQKKDCPNYSEIFKNMNVNSKNPCIFILDNELNNKEKPLKTLTNYMSLKKDKIDELCDKNYLKIISNLYIVTNPLVNGLNECEIEDLFELDTLKTELDGKTFERCEKKYSPSENYGKRVFSTYVWKNYEDLNFENFRPLLNNINQIVTNYND
ncbi:MULTISPECIES: retron Ec67 family RNA-directed DNA polymerase/endonuclease [Bacillus]|uniref:retron Ec67 family RNA-directed DNA polymerase/endonuclease n=1 Tax=Bacillus TaxID=1386 RepID=UPI000D6D459A|nr:MULTISPECIES: retron Ec67 family RNA-directed DNA polymerase/endonuclease [Bacillus]MDK4205492.1 retron Ec67 family RNA-directed DNA polymerase/endonuclease [Bacillus velezensis]PWJ97961.1 RNA-directed DNA polymerase [Bacillus sp. VMFN-A1]QHC10764.1 RNA-directed DNA polymerase [Bacillus velezensis]TRW31103.1 RNA-directed DNA polymerase [Bacillus sp. PW192]WBS13625.1 retron Ec67 family RNA-directed DNA polymerase/endonuclease [Bacillus velezensis]